MNSFFVWSAGRRRVIEDVVPHDKEFALAVVFVPYLLLQRNVASHTLLGSRRKWKCLCPLQISGATMDRVSLVWRLRRRARRGALCMAFFCISMALLYAICAENSVPVTDAIFGVRARTRAQPRAHSVIKVCGHTAPKMTEIRRYSE